MLGALGILVAINGLDTVATLDQRLLEGANAYAPGREVAVHVVRALGPWSSAVLVALGILRRPPRRAVVIVGLVPAALLTKALMPRRADTGPLLADNSAPSGHAIVALVLGALWISTVGPRSRPLVAVLAGTYCGLVALSASHFGGQEATTSARRSRTTVSTGRSTRS